LGCADRARDCELPDSGIPISHHTQLIARWRWSKQAAALQSGPRRSVRERCDAIVAAAQEIIGTASCTISSVDVFQAGAAPPPHEHQRSTEPSRLNSWAPREATAALHPNDHVNLSPVYQRYLSDSVRLSVLLSVAGCATRSIVWRNRSSAKPRQRNCRQTCRTQLQDAVPMTVGQELGAYAATIREDIQRLDEASRLLCEVNLGAPRSHGVSTPIQTMATRDRRRLRGYRDFRLYNP